MTSLAAKLQASLAALSTFGIVMACAHQSAFDEEPEDRPDQGDRQVVDGGAPGTASNVDASPEAGTCSVSGLCVVSAPIDETITLTSVWGSSDHDIYAVGSLATILHYDGSKWEQAARSEPDGAGAFTLHSVWLERPDDVWIADGRRLRHGSAWKGPTQADWSYFDYPKGPLPVAIRGRQNTVWVARGLMSAPNEQPLDRFDRWTEQEPTARETFGASGATLNALAVSSPDEAWATGTCPSGHCVFRMTRQAMDGSASTWQLEELDSRSARRLFGIWGDEHVVWLVGEGGTLRRLDKGQSLERRFDFVDSPVDSDLRCVFGFSKDDVWAVGEDSTVLHWDGTSWKRLETPFDDASKGPNLYAIWGSSPEDVWIVGEGTVLHFGGNAQ